MREKSAGSRRGKSKTKTARVGPDRRALLQAIKAVADKLRESGIDVRTSRPDVLKWQLWLANNEPLSDSPQEYTKQVVECLKLFRQRVGVKPKIVVLDVRRRSILQWHPSMLSERDVQQIRDGLKGGAPRRKVKASR